MGKNNPMNVEYYTYKVEFQERGAGHIHGTLWLSLSKLEELIRTDDGKLKCHFEECQSTDKENLPKKILMTSILSKKSC